jgi:hypothetical protein
MQRGKGTIMQCRNDIARAKPSQGLLSEQHQTWCADWALRGLSHATIAKRDGCSRTAVSAALRHPTAKTLIEEIRQQHQREVRARITGLAPAAVRVLRQTLADKSAPAGVRVACAQHVLALATGGPDPADGGGTDPALALRSFEMFVAGVRSIAATPPEGAAARRDRAGDAIEEDPDAEYPDAEYPGAESATDAAVAPQEDRNE